MQMDERLLFVFPTPLFTDSNGVIAKVDSGKEQWGVSFVVIIYCKRAGVKRKKHYQFGIF